MATPEQALKTAYSHLLDVEKEMPAMSAVTAAADKSANDGASFGAVLKAGLAVRQQRGALLESIKLADQEITAAASVNPNAVIMIPEDGTDVAATVPLLRGMSAHMAGLVFTAAGDSRDAERKFREALRHRENADTYYLLGVTLLNLRSPRDACEAFQKAADLDTDGETGVEARKALGRILSKKLFGDHWFVGSWKVAAVLGGLAVVSVLMILTGSPVSVGLTNLVIWGAAFGLYMKFKLR